MKHKENRSERYVACTRIPVIARSVNLLLVSAILYVATGVVSPDLAYPQGTLSPSDGSLATDTALQPVNYPELTTPASRHAIDRGLVFLASRQQADGSFGTGPQQYRGNVAICSLAGLAFMAGGNTPDVGPYGDRVSLVIGYILKNSQPSGLISHVLYVPGFEQRDIMYGHALAVLFLAECYGMSDRDDEIRNSLTGAVRLIVNSQNDEGGWRYEPRRDEADISVTVAQIMALRAVRNAGLHVPNETVERCTQFIRKCQNPDGGFMYIPPSGPSNFARTAMGVAALHSAGIYDDPTVTQGLAYLMQYEPRPGRSHAEIYFYYGHYYAVQVFYVRGGQSWANWYRSVRDQLVDSQVESDGSWESTISNDYATAISCIALQMPHGYLPIFQR